MAYHRLRVLLATVAYLPLSLACGETLPPSPLADVPVGAWPVGFRSGLLTRPAEDGPRRLQLSVWYPTTTQAAGQRVTVGDLFRIVLAEDQLDETVGLSPERGLAAAMTGDSLAITIDRARAALVTETMAQRDAAVAVGPFPLALWSSRHATVLAQAPLAEVLASHGFVVATVWSSDPPLAFLWEDEPEVDKLATIAAHTDDLMFALTTLRADPAVDGDRVALLAWSYGGQTAARVQERDEAVRVIISLDANVVPARVEERLALRRPLIFLAGRDTSRRGFERLSDLAAPVALVRLPQMAHGNFNALEGFLPAQYDANTAYPWSLGGEVAVEGYRSIVRMVTEAATSFVGQAPPSMEQLIGSLRALSTPVAVEFSLP